MSREYRRLSGSCLTQWRMGSGRDQALQVMQESAVYPTPEPCMSAQAGRLSRDLRPAIANCLMINQLEFAYCPDTPSSLAAIFVADSPASNDAAICSRKHVIHVAIFASRYSRDA